MPSGESSTARVGPLPTVSTEPPEPHESPRKIQTQPTTEGTGLHPSGCRPEHPVGRCRVQEPGRYAPLRRLPNGGASDPGGTAAGVGPEGAAAPELVAATFR